MISVLANVDHSHVVHQPYPHLVIPNALPDAEYRELEASFPSSAQFKQILKHACAQTDDNKSLKRGLRHLRRSNRRVNLSARWLVDAPGVAESWRQFIDFHSSDAFYHQLCSVFAEALAAYYPSLLAKPLPAARRGYLQGEGISLDALTAINTPARRRSEITGPHTDHPSKLFIGLYYFQIPGDIGGGDLVLYRRREPVNEKNLKWPKPDTVEAVRTVSYAPNTLVMLLNSPESVHGVTLRDKSPHARRFVNFVAEYKQAKAW
ncbi:hypothetical protein I6N98_00670 [Spongiibacter nanhainus]|uniref:2OG-Fe(II) oxygenase n=1 Tax=Spongiibacter nanhainus TaxID=2794344 RepID=A0A7T4R154_9GAMM|nr:hypothetical protein [Spongiibacter nanhainus]QQD18424.1 hypothetical protein I6N98_00670 [Spongiibacter nanhainus]